MTFGTSEQTRRLVEVTALQALSKIYMNRNLLPKIAECEKQLRNFAFPEKIEVKDDLVIDTNKNGHLPGCVCKECE